MAIAVAQRRRMLVWRADQLKGEIQKHQISQFGMFFSPMTNPLKRIMSETSGPAIPTATWLLCSAYARHLNMAPTTRLTMSSVSRKKRKRPASMSKPAMAYTTHPNTPVSAMASGKCNSTTLTQ